MQGTEADDAPHGPLSEPGTSNEVSGSVRGPVIQGRDFYGDLNFHLGSAPKRERVPRQVPPTPDWFVNRDDELEKLARLTTRREQGRGSAALVLLRGGRGVGKTAIGCHWAHANAERFVDGQLYVDFREHRQGAGVGVGDVLAELLRSLGLRDEAIPVAMGERRNRFRTETAGKRLLLLLDDVRNAAEVTPLVPTTGESVVLVTSHEPLEELFREGARAIDLEPLDDRSAAALLVELIADDERVRDDPASVSRLVEICAGLPVALTVCGARLASTGRPLAWLADLLSNEAELLAQIELDPERSAQVVFDEAYAALSEPSQLLHRRLGVFPGTSVTPVVAAALAGTSVEAVTPRLQELVEARLIEEGRGFRFRYHDLLRAHAHVVAMRADAEHDREAALRRAVDAYVADAQRMDRAIAADRLRLSQPPAPAPPGMTFRSPADALAWFEFERPNLIAVLRAAYDRELDQQVWRIGEAVWLAYRGRGHWEEAREVFTLAAAAARRCGDVDAEARMLSQVARAQMELGQLEPAGQALRACEPLMARSDNRALAASIIEWGGVLQLERNDVDAAIRAFLDARARFAEAGVTRGVAMQDYLLGRALVRAGEPGRAIGHLRSAASNIDPDTDQFLYGRVSWRLGEALAAVERTSEARAALDEAVEVLRRHSATVWEGQVRESLAVLERSRGDEAAEIRQLEAALAIYAEFGVARASEIRERLSELRP